MTNFLLTNKMLIPALTGSSLAVVYRQYSRISMLSGGRALLTQSKPKFALDGKFHGSSSEERQDQKALQEQIDAHAKGFLSFDLIKYRMKHPSRVRPAPQPEVQPRTTQENLVFNEARQLWNQDPGQIYRDKADQYRLTRCGEFCCTKLSDETKRIFGKLYGVRNCCYDHWRSHYNSDPEDERATPLEKSGSPKCRGFSRLEIEAMRWAIMREVSTVVYGTGSDTIGLVLCDEHICALLQHLFENSKEWPFPKDALPSKAVMRKIHDALVLPNVCKPADDDLDQTGRGKILNYPPVGTFCWELKDGCTEMRHILSHIFMVRSSVLTTRERKKFWLDLVKNKIITLEHIKQYKDNGVLEM